MYTRSRKEYDAEMDIYINEGAMDRGDGSSGSGGSGGSGGSAYGDLQFIILSLVVSAIVIFFL